MTEKRRYRFAPVPAQFEVRKADDGSIGFRGYAAVFDSNSEPLPFVEVVRPGAFKRDLNRGRNVRVLVDHNPEKLLASTRATTARVSEDDQGLLVDADLAPTSYGRDLAVLMERGEVNSMSFEFSAPASGQKWNDDMTFRELTDVRVYEVSILTGHDPAYPATSAGLRRLARSIETDEDTLADAIAALESGKQLDDEQYKVITAVAETLRETKPAEEPVTESEPTVTIPFTVLQLMNDLYSKQVA